MNIETFLEKELPQIHKQFVEGSIKSEDFLIAVDRYEDHKKTEIKKSSFHFPIHNRKNGYDDDFGGNFGDC